MTGSRYADGERGGRAPCSGSRVACGTGAGAARGGAGEARREAHQSISIPPRQSSVAPFLQPSVSASSTVRPAALPHQQAFLFSLSSNATGFRVQPGRAARLSPLLEAAQHLLKRSSLPASHLLCLPLIGAQLCEAAPRHACRRTPLLRVNGADAAAFAELPCACSNCACLPVVPDKQSFCTPVVGPQLSKRRFCSCGAAAQPHSFYTVLTNSLFLHMFVPFAWHL